MPRSVRQRKYGSDDQQYRPHEWFFGLGIVGRPGLRCHFDLLCAGPLSVVQGVDQNLAVLVAILGGVMPAGHHRLLQRCKRRCRPNGRARRPGARVTVRHEPVADVYRSILALAPAACNSLRRAIS